MEKFLILIVGSIILYNCNPSKITGYDCSFKINNNTSDTVYMGYQMNYEMNQNLRVHGHKLIIPNSNAGQCALGGSWDRFFVNESDSMYIYFIDKNIFNTNPWDFVSAECPARHSAEIIVVILFILIVKIYL